MYKESVVCELVIEPTFWGILAFCQDTKKRRPAGVPGLVLTR
jgi:hypothetical protein